MISDDNELTSRIVEGVYDLTGKRLELCQGPDCWELRFAKRKTPGRKAIE